jgi:hypothetical protein
MGKKYLQFIFIFFCAFCVETAYGNTPVAGDFRSKASGNWNDHNTWQRYNGTTWEDAASDQLPGSGNSVYLESGFTVDLIQDQSCLNLHINTNAGLRLQTGDNTLRVWGKIRQYTGVAPGTNHGAVGGGGANWIATGTSILNGDGVSVGTTGRVLFVGGSRNITVFDEVAGDEFGANQRLAGWTAEFALDPGAVSYIQTNFRAGYVIVSSGTINVQATSSIRPSGTSVAVVDGSLTVRAGAVLSAGSGFFQNNTTGFGVFTIEEGGRMNFNHPTPTIAAASLNILGTIELNRTSLQDFPTPNGDGASRSAASAIAVNNYNNVHIRGGSQKNLRNNILINGLLTLENGVVNLGAFHLTLGANSPAVSGTFGTTRMVLVSGAGQLRKVFSSSGSFMFPVGENTGTTEYTPITISVNSGDFTVDSYVGIRVIDDKHPDNISTTDFLSRYWRLSSNFSSVNYNAQATYLPIDVNGSESAMNAYLYNGGNGTPFQLLDTENKLAIVNGAEVIGDITGTNLCATSNNSINAPSVTTFCGSGDPDVMIGSIPDVLTGDELYQWQYRLNNGTWSNIDGATAKDYNAGVLSEAGIHRYRRAVTTTACNQPHYSNVVNITVEAVLANNSISPPATSTYCGSTTGLIISGTTPTGGSGSYTYEWERRLNGGAWGAVGGSTVSFNEGSLSDAGTYEYRRSVRSGACQDALVSDMVSVTIDPVAVGGDVDGDATVCFWANSGALNLSGHVGNVERWEASTDGGGSWSAIANTTSTLNYENLTETTFFRAVVSNGASCPEVESGIATITVDPATVGGEVSDDATVCTDANTGTLTLSGHVGDVLRWESSTDGGSIWSVIVNTNTTLDYDNLTETTAFRAVVQSGVCNEVESVSSVITVEPIAIGGSVDTDETVCFGANSGTLNLTGHTGVVIRWESSTDGGGLWSAIANTSTTLNYENLTETTSFRAIVRNGASCPDVESGAATITVDPATIGGQVDDDATVCSGVNSGTLSLNGHVGDVVRWEASTDGVAWTTIANTTSTQEYTDLMETTYFRAVVQNGVCNEEESNAATVTVDPFTVGGSVDSDATVCAGANAGTLTLNGHVGDVVRWESSTDGGGSWSAIAHTDASFDYNDLTQTTSFRAVVQSGVCSEVASDFSTITVDPVSVGGSVDSDATVCSGANFGTLSLSGHVGDVVRWEFSTDGGGGWSTIANTNTSYNYEDLTQTTSFRVIVQSGVCEEIESAIATITIDEESVGGTVDGNSTVCSATNSGSLDLSGHAGEIVRWESSIDGGSSWLNIAHTSATYNYENISQTTVFRAVIVNGICSEAPSSLATITFDPAASGPSVEVTVVNDQSPNGEAFATADGGQTDGYTFHWFEDSGSTPFATSGSVQNLTGGDYFARAIHQASGCSSTDFNFTILEESLVLTAGTATGLEGAEVVIPIRVYGFENVLTAQFSINWNSSVATYVNTEAYGISGMGAGNFGTTQASSGILTFSWDQTSGIPQTLADGSTFFAIRFQLTGSAGSTSPMSITGTPTAIEFTDGNHSVIPAIVNAGEIRVGAQINFTGLVTTPTGLALPNRIINISGDVSASVSTDQNGMFQSVAAEGSSLVVQPTLGGGDGNNGITTLDIAHIRRHILNIALLNTPYKIIAADVNASGSVSTADISLVRRVVLGIDNSFSGRLWDFVPSSHVFTNPANPFPFENRWVISNLSNATGYDFTAVRLGDVNESWTAMANSRIAYAGEVRFEVEGTIAKTSEVIEIPIKVKDFNKVGGYQFTFNWDANVLAFAGAEGVGEEIYFGEKFAKQGALTVSWDDPKGGGKTIMDDQVVAKIKFNVIGQHGARTSLSINSSITAEQAFNDELELMHMNTENGFVEVNKNASKDFYLLQNFPNPVTLDTKIPFYIEKASVVRLAIYNSMGGQIKSFEMQAKDGHNVYELALDNDIKGGSGVFFYSVENRGRKLTKKMIVIP